MNQVGVWITFAFRISRIVSLIYTMEDGAVAEMGLVGNDGMVGVALFMGGDTVPNRAVVQLAGKAIRMKAAKLQEEFHRGGYLQRFLLRYTQALITQISQTAVCNRLHSVEQRLSRWLLLCHDRVSFRRTHNDAGVYFKHARRTSAKRHGSSGPMCRMRG